MDPKNEKLPPVETEAPQPEEVPPTSTIEQSASWRPADYYASPPNRPRFPRWVLVASGVAAIVALLAMFAIGAFLRSGGLASFIALAIGQFQGELGKMIEDDVPLETREKLDTSLRAVRERLTSGTLEQGVVLPLLQEIQKVSKDRTVTGEEIDTLQSIVDEIGKVSRDVGQPVEL